MPESRAVGSSPRGPQAKACGSDWRATRKRVPRGPRKRTLEYVEEADRVQRWRCSTPGDFGTAVENLCIIPAEERFARPEKERG